MNQKMHADEEDIGEALIQELLANQFPEWAGLRLQLIHPQGTDNAMYRLGNDKVIRLPRTKGASASLEKEISWLPKLGPRLSIAIPRIVGLGKPDASYPFPWLICNLLDGRNPDTEDALNLHQAAIDLGSFVTQLRQVESKNAPRCRRGAPLKNFDKEVRHSIPLLEEIYDTNLLTKLWEEILKIPEWSKEPTWIHGDLHAGNLLAKDAKIHAVVDFGLAGIGDPACDTMVAWTLLTEKTRETFRLIVKPDNDTWNLGRGWALFLGIVGYPYYRTTNPTFARIAKRALDEAIKDDNWK